MIKNISSLASYWFDSRVIFFSMALMILAITQAFSQCPLPPAPGWSNDPSYCGSTSVTLKVTTYSSGISGHKWYTSETGSTEITPTTQGNPAGYSGAWTSEYLLYSGNPIQEYWVSSIWTQSGCSQKESSTRKKVQVVSSGSGVQVTPSVYPYSLCVGDVITLTASGGNSYSWSTGQTGAQISITATSSMTVSMTTTAAVCGNSVTIDVPLTVGAKVGPVSISGSSSVCQASTVTYNVTATNLSYYYLTVIPANAASSINNTNGQITWNSSYVGNATINVEAHAYGSCPTSTTTSMAVLVSAPPTQADAGININTSATCGATSVVLAANTPSVGSGVWSVYSGAGGSFANASSPTTTFSGTQDVNYTLKWTISNGGCTPSIDYMEVLLHKPPTVANAGADLNGLITCGITSLALQGNAPTAGAGTWSILSGAGGTIATPSSPNSTFSGLAGNTYTLQWEIAKSPCTSSPDQVVVKFNRFPSSANAGPDQKNSATCGQTSVTLAANTPAIGNGSWSVFSGSGGTFGNVSSPTSTFTGSPGVLYTLKWTITNDPCLTTVDYVDILLNPLPAGTPTVSANARFGPGPLTLTANGATGGETYQWNVSGNVTTGSTRAVSNATTNVTNYGTLAIVSTVGCTRTAPFNLLVYDNPVITASLPYVYLGSSSTLSTGTYDTYQWSNAATTQSITTATSGVYTVTVTKGSLSKTSDPFTLHTQLGGMNENFVHTLSAQIAGINPTTILLEPIQNVSQSIQYIDGLGRPMQNVNTQASPLKNDIVQPFVYDQYGRLEKRYLPFAAEKTGRYKDNTLLINATTGDYQGLAATFYDTPSSKVADDDSDLPFSKTVFEPSPLGRVIKQGAPGSAWQPNATNTYASTDHTVKHLFQTNVANEVLNWIYTPPTGTAAFGTIEASSSLAAGDLTKNSTKDENGREVIEYINDDGNVVLKRVQSADTPSPVDDANYASTYYIYDELRQLVCVIQPEGTKRITQPASEYFGKTASEKETFLQRWAFRYRYDNIKRMILKQVPGADSVRMVYDERDRLVFTQDGNQRATHKWSFTKYDYLNRPIITGEYTHSAAKTQREMAGLLSSTVFGETYNGTDVAQHGYTNTVLVAPNFSGTFDAHTLTYYDNHTFTSIIPTADIPAADVPYLHNDLAGQYVINTNKSFDRLRGQVTGTKTRVLGDTKFLWSINYYDDRYRIVQNVSSNHKGGVDRATSVYDFTGKATKTKFTHRVGGTTNTIEKDFNYDHAGRLVKTWHKVNSRPSVILSANEYNELGQLVTKKLHASADNLIDKQGTVYSSGVLEVSQYNNEPNLIAKDAVVLKPGFTTAGKSVTIRTVTQWTPANSDPAPAAYAQVVDYRYNIRGWMTSINDVDVPATDYFSMKLNYQSTTGSANDQFNGNIGQIVWAATGFDKQDYRYKYDAMNRLKEAKYYNLTNATKNDRFSETLLKPDGVTSAYDMNGNIMKLQRYGKLQNGFGLMDNLTYTYVKGNQLAQVDDAVAMNTQQGGFKESSTNDPTEYDYDANGSMKFDDNKAIQEIIYNHLNLPVMVKKSATEYIVYTYDASGRKLRQQVFGTQAKTTDYAGDYFYENDVLKFVNHEEGRIISSTVPAYEYFLKDHLGNVRTTFTTREEIEGNIATYEPSNLSNENNKFLRVTNARKVVSALFDRTNGAAVGYSQRLTGGLNEKFGYARSIGVMPGDVVSAEVYAKYVDPSSSNWTSALATLMSQITSATPPGAVVVDGAAYGTSTSSFTMGGLNGTGASTGSGPKAYLNWLVFDGDMVLLDGGYSRLSATPKESGQDVAHERLSSGNITITKPGFVYIYLSNEEGTPLEVYFDDFKVNHTKSPITQQEDYYPFGLTFNTYERESLVDQNFKFQSQEHIDALDLNWDSFKWRNHQPDIGKFFGVDPLAEDYDFNSPYAFSENKVISHRELEGLEADPVNPISDDFTDEDAVNAVATEIFETKHSFYNIILSVVGSDKRATFVQNEDGDYETGFIETHLSSQQDALNLSLDLLRLATFGRGPGGLLATTPAKSTIVTTTKAVVNGNSKASTKIQHGYVITKNGKIQEYGISGQKLNKNGTSPRAQQKLTKKYKGQTDVKATVVKKNMNGRTRALNWEKGKVRAYKKASPGNTQPPKQVLPAVKN